MKLEFKNIYTLSETIIRSSLDSYFWPVEQRNSKREALLSQNKKEGWLCNFMENGLLLDIKILISKADYADWPQNHRSQNMNTVKGELAYHEHIEYTFSEPVLKVKHLAEDAEDIRKKIYISNRFNERAHNLWAAQYFEPAGDRKHMFYMLGFDRDIKNEDEQLLSEIKKDLSFLKNISLL